MLQSMRHLAHSWPIKGLMLFLAVSFSIWGIGDIFRGNSLKQTVASAGNTDISVEQLNRLFEESLARVRQANPNATAQEARKVGILDKTLDNEIKRALIDQDIKRQGINVSQDYILRMIAEAPQFRNKDGSFNKEIFANFLQQQRKSEQSFVNQMQQDIARQTLIGALNVGHTASDTQIDALYKARAQKRILDVVTIDASKIGGVGTPDDKALHAFYDSHNQLFMAPEYRSLTFATLSTDTIVKDISISDEQVKKEYDDKLPQLAQPEKRDIIQVVLQDEEKAKQLAKHAHTSGNLTAAAKEAKETAIPLDQLDNKNLMPELSTPVFAMTENSISEPIKTQLGWHVIQLKKIIPAGTPSFASIKDKLREELRHDQAIEAATRTVNQLDDQLAAGHSLDDIADGLKLRLIKIAAIDATGLTPEGKSPAEIPNREQAIKDAFAQAAGETSPVEDDKAGTYYIIRTDDITLAGVKPFDSVKKAVIAAWTANEQATKAQAQADKIAQGLRDGKQPTSFANAEGVSVRTSTPLSQIGDSDALLPPDLIAQAFRIKKGETVQAQGTNKLFVARLSSVIDVDAKQSDPRKNKIVGEVNKALPNELLDQYIAHLYDVFPVKIHTAVMDRLRQQDN